MKFKEADLSSAVAPSSRVVRGGVGNEGESVGIPSQALSHIILTRNAAFPGLLCTKNETVVTSPSRHPPLV